MSCCGSGILRTAMNGTNLEGKMKQEKVIYLVVDVPTPGVLFPVFCAFDSSLQLFLSVAHQLQAEDKTKMRIESSDKVGRSTFHQLQTPSSSALRRFVALAIS